MPAKPDSEKAAAEWVDVEKLVAWADNPRDNSATVDECVESIKRWKAQATTS